MQNSFRNIRVRVVPRRTVVGDIDRSFDMTLMMTSAQVVETSVNVTNNSPSRNYSHPDDQTTQTTETPGFKPFTVILENLCLFPCISF